MSQIYKYESGHLFVMALSDWLEINMPWLGNFEVSKPCTARLPFVFPPLLNSLNDVNRNSKEKLK